MSTSPFFFKAFLGTNGRPAASGWFFAYAAGSTVPKPIYSDRNNTIPLANPLRLDGNGVCPQFFTEAGLYDFKVYEYNFVTPSAPGPSCFTAEDIDGETGSGGGPAYVLPIATETILGGVKPDGVTTFVDPVTGKLTAPEASYTLPVATTGTLGGIKPDGTTVQVDGVTGVLSVIPEEQTPELAGYAEGGYTEFTWINQLGTILGNSSMIRGVNSFSMSDFLAGMVMKFRWVGNLNSMNTTDVVFIEGLLGGQQMGQFDITPPVSGDYNVIYEATVYASSVGVSSTYLDVQSRVDFSKNGAEPAAPLYSHIRYWSVGSFLNTASIDVGVRLYKPYTGYQQKSFQAWMENAQRSSTPDPAPLFQPLEDQRLSTDRSVAFATATARAFRVDTVTPDATPVIGSTFWDADAKTLATHVENGSTLQHGQELVLYARNNSGANILDGQCVYITGASGNKCTIALASAINRTASHIIAVATQNINNNSDGYVTLAGRVNDINTAGFAEGAEVWLGDTPGSLVATLPSGASVRARIGYIIRSHATQGAMEVSINRFPFLSELSGSGVTTRTGSGSTSLTRFTRYTGSGGDTELLPVAGTITADRYYRNSGAGLWIIATQGGQFIDYGDPSNPVASVTLLPGQTLHLYAISGLWEAF